MTPSFIDLPWLPEAPDDFAARVRALNGSAEPLGAAVQQLAGMRLQSRQAGSLGRALGRLRASGADLAPMSPFRLGVLASSTYDLLLECLPAACARHGVALELVTTPYGQVMQQALAPDSEINSQRLDAVLVAVDHRWLNLDRPCLGEKSEARAAAAVGQLRAIVASLRALGAAPSILQTIPAPPSALFGSFERRVGGSIRSTIDEANRLIIALAEESGSYLLDLAALAERAGSDRWFDPIQWASYKLPFSGDCFPAWAEVVGRLLGAIRGKSRKCLVLDLDNTVWGGVVGDDGVNGIRVGQGHPLGEAFLAVQQAALDLRERGILLAVCSKNDEEVAREPFRRHPDMLLREDHITVFQANWIDKASNLEAIAAALNIGLDALVLLDDNPAERAQVRAALPMVAVPELPADPSWFPWFLAAGGYFEAVTFSQEDRTRADSYSSDRRRAEVMSGARDLGDYLASLGMVIAFSPFDAQGRQRVAQLINKTNQFNLTTRRYTEQEVFALETDASLLTLQVRLTDRFDDLGMISVVICRPEPGPDHTWRIDTWLMSCRVLGREVEQAVLAKIVSEAKERGIGRLVGDYLPTAKNGIVADHYRKLGFSKVHEGASGETIWALDVSAYTQVPLPIAVEERA